MNEQLLREILADFMAKLSTLLEGAVKEQAAKPSPSVRGVTKRALLELVSHEAIVLEAYKDSKGIWTWGIGVTNASGHRVDRYKDNPQTIEKVLTIFKWLIETKYLPAVLEAFRGVQLNEHQLAAALSFHYNTGAIGKASWVKSFKDGDLVKARREFMNWKKPVEIIPRRQKECDLFFDGTWSATKDVLVIPVSKPSYTPDFRRSKRIDISEKI